MVTVSALLERPIVEVALYYFFIIWSQLLVLSQFWLYAINAGVSEIEMFNFALIFEIVNIWWYEICCSTKQKNFENCILDFESLIYEYQNLKLILNAQWMKLQ